MVLPDLTRPSLPYQAAWLLLYDDEAVICPLRMRPLRMPRGLLHLEAKQRSVYSNVFTSRMVKEVM